MKRKKSIYKGLQFIPVWFEDRSLTSPDYFQISEFPNKLTAGKNLFKLRGNPINLATNTSLDIEILDYNNNPIYYEILNYIDDDKSRVVAIYIYDDTAAGECSITITAQSKNAPESWKDIPNIRWTRTVSVNPNISNESEIIFETVPDISITEQIGPHLDRIYSGSVQFPIANTGTVKYFSYNGQPAIQLNGGQFTKDMSAGTIVVNTPVNPTPTPRYTLNTTKYTSTIKKVLTPTLALLDKEYEVYSSSSLEYHTYYSFDESPYELTYEATPTYVATQNSESYALVEIKGLQPSTGDVSRIKLFMNNKGTVGTWESISDTELEETELFVISTSSIYPDTSIGLFTSQSIINTYWEGHSYQGFSELTAPVLTWNTSSLNNAMQISNSIDISANNSVTVAQTKSTYSGTFIKNSEYKITIDALGVKNNYNTAILSVYLSGSAFSIDYTDYLNQELPVKLGRKIGQISVTGNSKRFDDNVFKFTPDNTGTATLLIVVESGDWQISDIRTTSDNDIGYTPNYTRIKTLVPTAHKSNNQLSFKAEYYNVSGVKSKQISYVYNKPWEGGNRYIDGNYSMLTGSLYVADSLNTGVAISGYKNTGFIRSLGYDGFIAGYPGFLLWSGSALSGSNGTKGNVPYSGVGLELYANSNNYFRYSTTDNELDIRTDTIFIGNNSASFISASNGNLQISSSNFSIDASGNVTLTGAINITGGTGFATPSSVTASINSATSSLSASISTTITNNSSSAASSLTAVSQSTSDRIVTDAANKIIKPNNTPSGGKGLYLSQRYLGYYDSSAWNAYISSSGEFLFKANDDNQISFANNSFILKVSDTATISGSNINLVTPTFFFGNNTNFISGSNGNIRISGSNVSVSTPTFFFGNRGSTFVSGSNGNLQISASNFSIDASGNVTASNMHLNNVAYADGFVNNTIVITSINKNLYYENYQIDGLQITGSSYYTAGYSRNFTKLVLDGSKGGEAAQQVRIEYQPDWPIGMIIPPGYTPDSPLGYTISIENYSLNNTSNFGAIQLANAVASSSLNLSVNGYGINSGTAGPDNRIFDFGFNADVWDFNATAYQSTLLGSGSIRGITNDTLIMYGQNTLDARNCWNNSTQIQRGMIHIVSYGGTVILRRTTNGSNAGALYLPDSYWDIIYEDDIKNTEKYFGAAKFGNRGVIIGGQGSVGSRLSDVHQNRPHGSAVLQLDAGNSSGSWAEGSGSVFIPPRITTSEQNNIGNPVNGSIIYNSDTNKLQVYAAGSWVNLH